MHLVDLWKLIRGKTQIIYIKYIYFKLQLFAKYSF